MQYAAAAVSAAGSIYEGKSKAAALQSSADVQRQNAIEARQQAEFDAARQGQIADQKIGTATAAYGASGVSADSGSVMDVMAMSHSNAELDKLNILHGGDIRAINYENQASMDKAAASNSVLAGYINAGAAAFGYGGKAAGSPGATTQLDQKSNGPITDNETAGIDSAGEVPAGEGAAGGG